VCRSSSPHPKYHLPTSITSHAHPWGIINKELAHHIQDVTFPLDKQVIRNAAGFIVPADTTPRSLVILIKGHVFLADQGNPWRPEVHCFYDATIFRSHWRILPTTKLPSLLDEIRQHLAPWYILEALDSQKGHCPILLATSLWIHGLLLWLALNWYFSKSSVTITGLFEKINDGPMIVSPSSISNGFIKMVAYNVFFNISMALIRNIESPIIANHGLFQQPF